MGVDPKKYRPRVVDEQVERYLRLFGTVAIGGTKWCGKTWTSRRHARSITYVDRGSNLDIAAADPAALLAGERPHVIDEWQRAPEIWNTVRHAVDDLDGEKGAWILIGSSTPIRDRARHSGAGGFGRIKMLPMALSESGDSSCRISLACLFEGNSSMLKRKLRLMMSLGMCQEVGGRNPSDCPRVTLLSFQGSTSAPSSKSPFQTQIEVGRCLAGCCIPLQGI